MNIAFLTEGTYPQTRGGVSTWCDQLVHGLPEHTFHVHAITGERAVPTYPLPANVRVQFVPIWDVAPGPVARPTRVGEDFHAAHEALLRALFRPELSDLSGFLGALRAFHEFAQGANLSAALTHRHSIERVWREWQRCGETPQVRSSTLPLLPRPSLADAVQASTWLDHLLRPLSWPAPEAGVLHATGNGLSMLLALSAKWRYGTPLILTEHGMYLRERYLEYPRTPFSPALRAFLLRFQILLSRVGYELADMITPVSEYNSRWAVRAGGADPGRVQSIHNGINPDKFRPPLQEPSTPTVCWVGRIDPLKDVETLIRAFAEVRRSLPDARLRLFGGVPAGNEAYARRCTALVSELGLGDGVRFEGHTSQVLDGYHAGHVVALTSISEGFPYTVIEAMSAGRATVATDVGGVREAVGEAGLVVPPHDFGAVARACTRLLTDAALRERLGKEARERVLEMFTLERCLGTYRHIYPNVAANRGLPGLISPGLLTPGLVSPGLVPA